MSHSRLYAELRHLLATAPLDGPVFNRNHPEYAQVQTMLADVHEALGIGRPGHVSQSERYSQT